MDAQVGNEIERIMTELKNDAPDLVGIGYAGGILAGGMAAGVGVLGVLAAPLALVGWGGYALAKKRKKARMLSALNVAIEKLYAIQERLKDNAEHFREELGALTSLVEKLKTKRSQI